MTLHMPKEIIVPRIVKPGWFAIDRDKFCHWFNVEPTYVNGYWMVGLPGSRKWVATFLDIKFPKYEVTSEACWKAVHKHSQWEKKNDPCKSCIKANCDS